MTNSSFEVVESKIQLDYYKRTAYQYNDMHVHELDEHYFSLSVLLGIIDFLAIKSILDIGSGTGRTVQFIKNKRPDILIRGIEPVKELREIAYAQGITPTELTDGNVLSLNFADATFDLVCEFGVLHHVKHHERAVQEMLRTSRKAVFLSDSNNFGQGGVGSRLLKQVLHFCKLWPTVNFIKTWGRGYTISEGDGLAYSYSIFSDYPAIKRFCESVHLINTVPASINPYRTSSHVALLGIKKWPRQIERFE